MNIKNMFRGMYKRKNQNDISFKELEEMIKNINELLLIDVRSTQEYEERHLRCSVNIPLYEIERCVKDIIPDLNQIIVVYCQSGRRSGQAAEILNKKGYRNVYNLKNGLDGI